MAVNNIELFQLFADNSSEGINLVSESGDIIIWNKALETMTGIPLAEARGKKIWSIQYSLMTEPHKNTSSEDKLKAITEKALATGEASWLNRQKRIHILQHQETLRILEFNSFPIKTDKGFLLATTCRDISERIFADHEKDITLKLLQLINEADDLPALLDCIAGFIKDYSGCEAIGIRLKDKFDYPYAKTIGFPPEFLREENSLYAKDLYGQLRKDENGKAVFDCLCANVIFGSTPQEKNCFTGSGSFFTNSLAGLNAERGTPVCSRNRCYLSGYESTALIPLKKSGMSTGLIQLCDRRKNRLHQSLVSVLEKLSGTISAALYEKKLLHDLKLSEEKFKELFNTMNSGVVIFSPDANGDDFILKDLNKVASNTDSKHCIFIPGKSVRALGPDFEINGFTDCFYRVYQTGKPEELPVHQGYFDNGGKWYKSYIFKLSGGDIVLVFDDVTQNIEYGNRLLNNLNEKELLFREMHHRVKNNLQIFSSILGLQIMKEKNPAIIRILEENRGRIHAMAVVHELLYTNKNARLIHMRDNISRLVEEIRNTCFQPGTIIETDINCEEILLPLDLAIPCSLIINELVTNAFKYAFTGRTIGSILISLVFKNGNYELVVSDNGRGTSVPLAMDKANSLGMELVYSLTTQLDGTIRVEQNNGLSFIINFKAEQKHG